MIINPSAKKVLCFGDSLTWGNYFDGNRFPIDKRWTYMLQEKLGDGFDVVEEGLRSRTTNSEDPSKIGRNGYNYFCPCVESNGEIDVLVLLLGTNDSKEKFKLSADSILTNLKLYVDFIRSFNSENGYRDTAIILMSPPQINLDHITKDGFNAHSNEVLIELSQMEELYCRENNLHFIDLHTRHIGNTRDGVHLEDSDNVLISDLLFQKIRILF